MVISNDLELLRDDRGDTLKVATFVATTDRGERQSVHEPHSCTRGAQPEFDPALLAFIKCHVTSFARWDLLRALSEQVGCWTEPLQLAQQLSRPVEKIRATLDDLCGEGILEATGQPGETVYRLPPEEPTSVVVARLRAQAARSQELRRVIVARILHAAIGPGSVA